MSVSLIWLRRDLRLADNPALAQAKADGRPILFLFHLDSERLERHDVDGIHVQWELDCLDNLREEIERKGGVVLFRFGQILDSLNELHEHYNIQTIYGNEESGLQWSWNRDKSVAKWCNENDVQFEEFPSNGVIRRLRSRDDWKALRDRRIDSSLVEAPQRIRAPDNVESDVIPHASELGFEVRELQQRPEPGESAAMDTLFSFLDERGRGYRKGMSSPISGEIMCSRLSPYLSTGCISIRQIFYHTKRKQRRIKTNPRSAENRGWSGSLSSFQSRLAWHCHFMQRLEAEATLDEQSMNPELDALLVRPLMKKSSVLGQRVQQDGHSLTHACDILEQRAGSISACERCCNRLHPTHSGCRGEHQEPILHDSFLTMNRGFTGRRYKCNPE